MSVQSDLEYNVQVFQHWNLEPLQQDAELERKTVSTVPDLSWTSRSSLLPTINKREDVKENPTTNLSFVERKEVVFPEPAQVQPINTTSSFPRAYNWTERLESQTMDEG